MRRPCAWRVSPLPVTEADIPVARLTGYIDSAVREAGALALGKFGAPVRNWTKGKNSPVCEADIAVDHLLRERLMTATPDYGWLSEESAGGPRGLPGGRVGVVARIDGARGFIAGRCDWAVSVALVEDGRPFAAALFAPATDEMFCATRGQGATRNGQPIRASAGSALAGARFAGPPRRLEHLATIVPGIEAVPKIFSLALRLCALAARAARAALAGPT